MIPLLLLLACEPEEAGPPEWPYELPAGFPAPPVPLDNPITDEKVELGRYLFYDRRLSGNGEQSCGDCHKQELAFADGRALPVGSTGDTIPRNAMALPNAAWWSTYTWMNPTLETLEDQALVPMFGELPVELGMSANMPEILLRLRGDAFYQKQFPKAFPYDPDPFTISRITQAIASFERTLISGNSPYDRYWYGGDDGALTDQQKLGMDIFFSERAECYHCHAGPLFSTAFVSANQPAAEPSFINTGLYNLGGSGDYPAPNVGLYEFTQSRVDMGRFRVPTLRNVALSAPYFHDGSAATLGDVVDHYMAGGRTIADGELAGVGVENPYKHPLVRPFDLTVDEKAALIAFMESLTDEDFLSDPRFASPFPE